MIPASLLDTSARNVIRGDAEDAEGVSAAETLLAEGAASLEGTTDVAGSVPGVAGVAAGAEASVKLAFANSFVTSFASDIWQARRRAEHSKSWQGELRRAGSSDIYCKSRFECTNLITTHHAVLAQEIEAVPAGNTR